VCVREKGGGGDGGTGFQTFFWIGLIRWLSTIYFTWIKGSKYDFCLVSRNLTFERLNISDCLVAFIFCDWIDYNQVTSDSTLGLISIDFNWFQLLLWFYINPVVVDFHFDCLNQFIHINQTYLNSLWLNCSWQYTIQLYDWFYKF
jgi:hypothetical protein